MALEVFAHCARGHNLVGGVERYYSMRPCRPRTVPPSAVRIQITPTLAGYWKWVKTRRTHDPVQEKHR